MADMKNFIDGECGSANPLVQIKSHFSNDATSFQLNAISRNVQQSHQIISKPLELSKTHEFVDEFLSASALPFNNVPMLETEPMTFCMDSLLLEMQQIDREQHSDQLVPLSAPIVSDFSEVLLADKWLDEIQLDDVTTVKTQQYLESSGWLSEFLANESKFNTNVGFGPLEPLWQNYEIGIEGQKDDWLEDFIKDESNPLLQTEQEYVANSQETFTAKNENEEEQFWEMAHKEWSDIENNWDDLTLEQDFPQFNDSRLKEYQFEGDNPVKDHPNPLQEGIRRLQEGDVSNAVLFLEAAVQKDQENSTAWFYLGQSQADNEQEIPAILAFEKCIELDNSNLKALMSLAVSYTNENRCYKALDSLLKWLKQNPKYSQFGNGKILEDYRLSMNSISSEEELIELFLQAARMSPGEIDADLQDGLGVLFNLSGDYEKAADCFRTAIQVSPENSTLWNKLGATLANGDKSEEALVAYHRALSLRPGYVRTRFNLGVACYNLKAYKESIEHYLSALNLQKNSVGPSGKPSLANSQMSDNIWSSLRLSLCLMGCGDLLTACDTRELDVLNGEWNLL